MKGSKTKRNKIMHRLYLSGSADEVLSAVQSDSSGLRDEEVRARLSRDGKNEILTPVPSIWRIFASQYANFLMLLLILGAAFSFYLGELVDGLVITVILLFNGVLGTYQEHKAERLSQALNKHLPQNVKVRRDNREQIVHREDITVGDIVLLEPGQLVPADLRLTKSFGIQADESILTGESVSVAKQELGLTELPRHLGEMTNMLFNGTMVINGSGEGVVVAVGSGTEFGRVISFANHTKKRSSFLHQVNGLSNFLFRMTLLTSSALFVALFIFKPELGTNHIFLFAVALAIAIVPEMLPLISTIALSRSALVLMKRGVLIKRLSSLEDLGGVEILLTDKTGTITKNTLTVTEVLAPRPQDCMEAAFLASNMMVNKEFILSGSFDMAIKQKLSDDQMNRLAGHKRLWEETFNARLRWQFNIIQLEETQLFLKGAPESVLTRCAIADAERERLLNQARNLGRRGLRTLAVARAVVPIRSEYSHDDVANLEFLGLIVFDDPIKSTAATAIKQAEALGVKIKILTGDAPEVARAVAAQAGLEVGEFEVITGEQIEQSADQHRIDLIRGAKIFARVNPVQKYEILQVFNKHHSVMFLGEGVNDAPAIKSADVGMVVEEASDIAKETADIVLTKPDLGVIIQSIYLGRQIMNNIAKYILITLTGNFGSLYGISMISIITPTLPLLPTQVLLENILTDVPMIGTINNQISNREQRKPFKQNIREIGFAATILGFVMMLVQFVFYQMFKGLPLDLFRTLWLMEIVLLEFTLIISLRTTDWFWRASRLSTIGIVLFVGVVGLTFGLPFLPVLGPIFSLVPYDLAYLVPITILVVTGLVIVELGKRLLFREKSFFNNHH